MTDIREATDALLADRPELASDLRTLLEIDQDRPWTFNDIPLDSGQFGEVVSRGLVAEHDDGYVLRNREEIRAAIDGDGRDDSETTASPTVDGVRHRISASRVDLAALVGAVVLVVGMRSVFAFGSVFRDGRVVIAGNDPYLFVYWVEYLLDGSFQAFDPGSLAQFPEALANHDLLLVVITWWQSALLGGSAETARLLLAWYPVVAAVIVGVVVYRLALTATKDRRIGVAALALFAVTPVVGYRMGLGFADHDALDLVWLGVTALAMTAFMAKRRRSWRAIDRSDVLLTALLGVAIASQILTWRGGPLFVVPVGLFAFIAVLSILRTERSPTPLLVVLFAGLAIASVLTTGVHLAFGWFSLYRVLAPVLLAGGVVVLAAFASLVRQYDLPLGLSTGTLLGVGVASLLAVWLFVPPLSAGLAEFVDYMAAYTWGDIVETKSIFSGELGSVIGPFLFLGFGVVLGLGSLFTMTYHVYGSHRPAWLAIVVYGWYFLLLAVVQNRFAGPFAVFNAVLAGPAFVHLASAVDIAAPVNWKPTDTTRIRSITLPDRRTVGTVVVLFMLVASLGLVQTPIKQSQLTISEDTYEVSTFLEEYADEHELTYPENYVFSEWGRNRAFNHMVSGESHSYDFAKDNYGKFIFATDSRQWYDRLANRTGFIVTEPLDDAQTETMQTRLHDHFGSQSGTVEALEHYQVIYDAEGNAKNAFRLVPGAVVTGTVSATESVTVSTTVTVPPSGTEFEYTQTVAVDSTGAIQFRTPYPGTYTVGNRTVNVSADAVENGNTVEIEGGSGR